MRMMEECCIHNICLYALDPDGPKLFGFAEYLAAMALLVLAWTIAYARYQIRIETAPLSLQRIAFINVTYARNANSGGAARSLNGAATAANASSTGYDFGVKHSF